MSAGPLTRILTKDEFEQLLQRAAARDVFREPRLFTHHLLEGYGHPEQAWVVDEIESWLGR